MDICKVCEHVQLTNVSKNNNKFWQSMIELAKKYSGEVLFDFEGIELDEPWRNEYFKTFLSDERISMKVYTSEILKDTIETMLMLGNMKTGRVINEDIEEEFEELPDNVNIRMKKEKIHKSLYTMKKEDGSEYGFIPLYREVYSQLSDVNSVRAIEEVIREDSNNTGKKEYVLDLEYIVIQEDILKRLANMYNSLMKDGIKVEIKSEDEDAIGNISIFQCIDTSRIIPPQERVKILGECIPPKTVGMFSKFQKTRKLDMFGRMGEGKPIICRPAIYLGCRFNKSNGKIEVKFRTFLKDTFYTKRHYSLDHDGEELEELATRDYIVDIMDLGLCDKFIGRLYHFNLPIQYKKDDGYITYRETFDKGTDEVGRIATIKKTLPEYIKMVLDDHQVDYSSAELLEAIIYTKKLLGIK